MRTYTNLNAGWTFTKPGDAPITVDVPHTWNNLDGQDGGNDYWRGTCAYERCFTVPAFNPKKQVVYLEFEGVNATADVEVNGIACCHHDGGYSTFRTNVTELVKPGENGLLVHVDNSKNDRVYPQKADFTFYGGIYRDVRLLVADATHFSLDYHGGPGIAVTPKIADGEKDADVRVQTWVDGPEAASAEVRVTLTDASGATVGTATGTDVTVPLPDAHRWDGLDDPYLYAAKAQLVVAGTVVDEVSARFGVRSFSYDAKGGFFLNGRSYPLRGVCRHQDRKALGNALTEKEHREDMALIREIGANTLRLAHYQQAQFFYDLCDEAGIVVWAEIPYISEHMPNGRENTISQMTELITQSYNHPSIVCWGVSNEITISTKDKADMLDNHRVLDELCHKLDPTRFTTLACYAMCGPFNKSAFVTDVVSWNLYLGWYVPGLFLNDLWFGFFHLVHPNRVIGMSEYGCEAMPNLHSSRPRRNDHTEEYQCVYHEYMLKFFAKHPYLWATHVWNMFDFAADARDQGGEPGMNHKGLITFDRKTKKDSFYIYKAWWSNEPFVHLCGKRYVDRAEEATSVKVYSNQKEVTLFVNGSKLETRREDPKNPHVFTFFVPLKKGENSIEVTSGQLADSGTIRRVDTPNPDYVLQKKSTQKSNWADNE